MNKVLSHLKEDTGKSRYLSEEIQQSIYPFKQEINITDGGEFIDDNIRMSDQQVDETIVKEMDKFLQLLFY